MFHGHCLLIGFISRNEFSDVVKLILHGENDTDENANDAYVEELTAAMDFDKNGKIDVNEFLGTINH
jgi:Ca2+-binding EF-hand superfamily protein